MLAVATINHCYPGSKWISSPVKMRFSISLGVYALRYLSIYDSTLQSSFILGNTDSINIFRGQPFVQKCIKPVFFCIPDCKKVRLLNFSPFNVFSMPWWMGNCVVCTSSSSVEQKITTSCRKDIDLFLWVQKSRRYYQCHWTFNDKVHSHRFCLFTLNIKMRLNFPLKSNKHHSLWKKKAAVLYVKKLLHMTVSLLLWIASQKRFVLRVKLIQCEIKSPLLYLREAHRGHSWCWASWLCSISAHWPAGNIVHASAWQNMPCHPCNNTILVHLLYSCYIQTI